jgi:hypothetical protein
MAANVRRVSHCIDRRFGKQDLLETAEKRRIDAGYGNGGIPGIEFGCPRRG